MSPRLVVLDPEPRHLRQPRPHRHPRRPRGGPRHGGPHDLPREVRLRGRRGELLEGRGHVGVKQGAVLGSLEWYDWSLC